jgi:hypothetical protein
MGCSFNLSGQVRQLAAIEMRKRVSANSGNLWLQVPQSDREQLKTQLPQIVLRESKRVSFSPIVPAFR